MRLSVGFDLSQCQEKLSYQAQECRKTLSRPIPQRHKKKSTSKRSSSSPREAQLPQSPIQTSQDAKSKKIVLITTREAVSVLPPQKRDFVVTAAAIQNSTQEVDVTVHFNPISDGREKTLPPLSSVEADSHVGSVVEPQPQPQPQPPPPPPPSDDRSSSVDVAHLRADLDTYKDIISMLMTDFRLMKTEFDELKQERTARAKPRKQRPLAPDDPKHSLDSVSVSRVSPLGEEASKAATIKGSGANDMVDSLDWVQVSDEDDDNDEDHDDGGVVDGAYYHDGITGKVARIVKEKERIISSLSHASSTSSSAMLLRGDSVAKGIRSSSAATTAAVEPPLPPGKSASQMRRSFRQPPSSQDASSPTKRPIDWSAVSHRHNFIEQNKHNVVLLNHAMKLLSKDETSSSFVKASLRRAILQEGPSLNPSLSPLVSPTVTAKETAKETETTTETTTSQSQSQSQSSLSVSSSGAGADVDSAPVSTMTTTPTTTKGSSSALPPALQLPPYPSSLPPSRRPSDASLVSLASTATASSVVASPIADQPPLSAAAVKGKRAATVTAEHHLATPTSSQPSSAASTPRRVAPSSSSTSTTKPTPSPSSSASKPLAAAAAAAAAGRSPATTPSSHHPKPSTTKPSSRTPPTPPVKTPLGKIRHHGKIDFILENKIEVKRTSDSVHYLRTVASSSAASSSSAVAGGSAASPAATGGGGGGGPVGASAAISPSTTTTTTTAAAAAAVSAHQILTPVIHRATLAAIKREISHDTRQEFLQLVHHHNGGAHNPKQLHQQQHSHSHSHSQQSLLGDRTASAQQLSLLTTDYDPKKIQAVTERAQSMFETPTKMTAHRSSSTAKLLLLAAEEEEARQGPRGAAIDVAPLELADTVAPASATAQLIDEANPMHATAAAVAQTPPSASSPSPSRQPSSSSFLAASSDVFTAEVQRSMRRSHSRQTMAGQQGSGSVSVASSHRRSFSLGPAPPTPPPPQTPPPSSQPAEVSSTEALLPSADLTRKPSALSAAFFADVLPITTVASCDGLDDEGDGSGGRGALDVGSSSCGASFDENEDDDEDKPFRLVGVQLTPTWDRMKKRVVPTAAEPDASATADAAAAAVDGGRPIPPPRSSSSSMTAGAVEEDASSSLYAAIGAESKSSASSFSGQPAASSSAAAVSLPYATTVDDTDTTHTRRPPQKRPSIFASWTSTSTDDS